MAEINHRKISCFSNIKMTSFFIWIYLLITVIIYVTYSILCEVNCDVSYFLNAVKNILQGASLYKDIYEPNAPFSFYFWIVPIYLSSVLNISEILCYYIFIAIFTGVSLLLSWKLLLNVFQKSPSSLHCLIFLSLSFVFLVYPTGNLGQREHMMAVLTVPYILLCLSRLSRFPVDNKISLISGVLAGMGLAFKPHFCLLPLIVEFYLRAIGRVRVDWRRPELTGMLGFLVIYHVLWFWYIDGYGNMLKLAWHSQWAYYININYLTFTSHAIPFAITTILFIYYIIFYSISRTEKNIISLMYVVVVYYFIITLLQRKGFPYHFYPTIVASSILSPLIIYRMLQRKIRSCNLDRLIVLGLIIMLLLGMTKVYWHYHIYRQGEIPRLITLAKQFAEGKNFYFISTYVRPGFPVVSHARTSWPYHFTHLWPLPARYKDFHPGTQRHPFHPLDGMDEIEQFVFATVIEDLLNHPPALLVVDRRPTQLGFNFIGFDYLAYFSQDKRFSRMLAGYDLIEKVGFFSVYRKRE
jgi:hypothetical protein